MRLHVKNLIEKLWILICCVISAFPFIYVFLFSLQSKSSYQINPFRFKLRSITLDNYRKLLFEYNILWKIGSNTIIVVISCLISLLLSTAAAYAISQNMKSWYSYFILFVCVLIMFLPQQITVIPEYIMYAKMNMINNYLSVILSYSSSECCTMLFILLFCMLTLRTEILDAARLDGASEGKVLLLIVTPMIKSGVCVALTLSTVTLWNELLIPMLFLPDNDLKTVSVSINGLINRYNNNPPYQMAAIVIAMMPLLVLYFLGRKYLVGEIIKSNGIVVKDK